MENIRVGDHISWKRAYDARRTFGEVRQLASGFIVATTDRGVRCALRPRDVTREGT